MSSRGVIRFLKKIEELDKRYSADATEEERKRTHDAYLEFDRESRHLTRFYNSALKADEDSKNEDDGDSCGSEDEKESDDDDESYDSDFVTDDEEDDGDDKDDHDGGDDDEDQRR